MTASQRLLPNLTDAEEQRIVEAIGVIKGAGELQPVSKFPPITSESVYDATLFGRPCVWSDPAVPNGLVLVHGERRMKLRSGTPVIDARHLPFKLDRECRIFSALVNVIEGRSDVYAIASLMLETGVTTATLKSLGAELSTLTWVQINSLERHAVAWIQ
jgi:hypothetical protein